MSQVNQQNIKIKVCNADDTRLFYYQSVDFAALKQFITNTWSITDFIAQYKDDEGDLLTIASSQDLQGAIDFTREENAKSLKIFVKSVKPVESNDPQPKSDETESKSEEPVEEPAQPGNDEPKYKTNGEMFFDFFTNKSIIESLLSFFGVLINQLLEKGCDLSEDEIAQLIMEEISKEEWNLITSHALYRKVGMLVIPYVAKRICAQQSLYPHFRVETIQTWIQQLIDTLLAALQSDAVGKDGCVFKDIAIDIQYPAKTDTGKVIHFGVECDICGQFPIVGDRYKSLMTEDWDCCAECEPQHDGPLIKFKQASNNYKNASFHGLAEVLKRLSPAKEEGKDEVVEEPKEKVEESVVNCTCGSPMQKVVAKHAYRRCNTVYCDICNVQFFNEEVYHCPRGYDNQHHRNGYDICVFCAEKQQELEEEKHEEPKVEEPQPEEPKVEEPEPEPEPQVEEPEEPQVEEPEPEEAPASDVSDIWPCKRCTFINKAEANNCLICGSEHEFVVVDEDPEPEPEPEPVEREVSSDLVEVQQPQPVPSAPPAEIVEVQQPAPVEPEPQPEPEPEPEVVEEFVYENQLNTIEEILGGGRTDVVKALLVEYKGDVPRVVAQLLQ